MRPSRDRRRRKQSTGPAPGRGDGPALSAAIVAIVFEGFLARLSYGLIAFALPLYAVSLGLGIAQIGVLVTLNLAVAALLKPLAGAWADRVGPKRALLSALSLRSVVAALLVVAGAGWQLFAIRSAHGVTKAVRDPASGALIATHGRRRSLASYFAWYQTAKTVAGTLGRALAGFLLAVTASSYSIVFLCAFLLSSLPLGVVGRLIPGSAPTPPSSPEDAASVAKPEQGSGQSTGRPPLFPLALCGFLISGAGKMLHGLFPVLAVEYAGLSEGQTGAVYFASAVVVVVAGPGFGWLADHVNRKLVLAVRGGANALSSVVYLAAPNLGGMLVGQSVDAAGKAAFRSAWGAVSAEVAGLDRHRRASIMARLGVGQDAGEIVGPLTGAVIWGAAGVVTVLVVRVGLALVAEVYAMWALGPRGPLPAAVVGARERDGPRVPDCRSPTAEPQDFRGP